MAAVLSVLFTGSLPLLQPSENALAAWEQIRGNTAHSATGDQKQYVHAPFEWVKKFWEAQGRPSPGPTIAFNTSFGMTGRSGFTGAPAQLTFPMLDAGMSSPVVNTAEAFTDVLPMLQGGSAMLSNSYYSVFTHHELSSGCQMSFNITTATGEQWGVPLSTADAVSLQPITTILSSDHRTFDVDPTLCATGSHRDGDERRRLSEGYCCGYFNPAEDDALVVQAVPYACRDLLFTGEIYGFTYPRLDFVFTGSGCGMR